MFQMELELRTGRGGQLAGPGRPFKARGPKWPKTGRKAFQDENKSNLKTKISVQIIQINYPYISKYIYRVRGLRPRTLVLLNTSIF